MSSKVKLLLLVAAIVIPGGFIALGAWKAFDLAKGKKEDGTQEVK